MRPIIFSTEMVRAILDGRKTQTRRVIKPQPPPEPGRIYGPEFYTGIVFDRHGGEKPGPEIYGIYGDDWGRKCPYQPGDILWVRETWGIPIRMAGEIIYRADYADKKAPLADGEKWRPSIHMPREAARLFLLVKAVRVERLQEITPEEIDREGTPFGMTFAPYAGFSELWDIIHAKRGYGWESNPWVWVIEFERTEVPHDQ